MKYLLNILIFSFLGSIHSLAYENENLKGVHIIPFKMSAGLMLVEAEINGIKGLFIFDTGADALLINEIEIKGSQQIFQTIQGDFNTQRINIKDLRLGTFEVAALEAFTTDLSMLEAHTGEKILGIIGSKMFRSDVVHINNVKNTIELYPIHLINTLNKGKFQKSDITIENDIPIMHVKIGNIVYRFALDTGASISIIDVDNLRDVTELGLTKINSANVLTANNTQVSSKKYQLDEVLLDDISIKELNFIDSDLSDLSTQFDNDIAGILSIEQLPFSDIIIDFKSSKVYFRK